MNRANEERIQGTRVQLKNPNRHDKLSQEVEILKLRMKDAGLFSGVIPRINMAHFTPNWVAEGATEPLFSEGNERYPDVAGDSGALVYSMDKSIKIPLGIHLGKPPESHSEQSSAFLSLDSYVIEAHLLGLQLEFEGKEWVGKEEVCALQVAR